MESWKTCHYYGSKFHSKSNLTVYLVFLCIFWTFKIPEVSIIDHNVERDSKKYSKSTFKERKCADLFKQWNHHSAIMVDIYILFIRYTKYIKYYLYLRVFCLSIYHLCILLWNKGHTPSLVHRIRCLHLDFFPLMYLYHCFLHKKIESWCKGHSYIPTISKKQMYNFIEAVLNTTFNCLKTLSSPFQMSNIFVTDWLKGLFSSSSTEKQWLAFQRVLQIKQIYIKIIKNMYSMVVVLNVSNVNGLFKSNLAPTTITSYQNQSLWIWELDQKA